MYKPFSKDPKCVFSVSLPVSLLQIIEENLQGKSRSEFIKDAICCWVKKKRRGN